MRSARLLRTTYAALASSLTLSLAACADGAPLAPGYTDVPRTADTFDGVGRIVWVTSSADVGPGTLRAAVEEANADPAVRGIRFNLAPGSGQIEPRSQIEFHGTQALTVEGPAHIVTLAAPGTVGLLFRIRNALTLRNFGVEDANKVGIAIMVPSDAVGTVQVTLEQMVFLGNYSHAIWITDQAVAESDVGGYAESGAPASLDVTMRFVRATNNAFERDDDAMRITDGGAGDLRVTMDTSWAQFTGGEGLELDERGGGDLVATVTRSHFNNAGRIDAGDGLDGVGLRESGDGSVLARFSAVDSYENAGGALEIEELGTGDVVLALTDVMVSTNGGSAVIVNEDADGTGTCRVSVDLVDVTVQTNALAAPAAAVQITERSAGDLGVRVVGSDINGNSGAGLVVQEFDDGTLAATLQSLIATANAGDGIVLREAGAGDLVAGVRLVSSTGNGGVGLRMRQSYRGTGRVRISGTSLVGNTFGPIAAPGGEVLVVFAP